MEFVATFSFVFNYCCVFYKHNKSTSYLPIMQVHFQGITMFIQYPRRDKRVESTLHIFTSAQTQKETL